MSGRCAAQIVKDELAEYARHIDLGHYDGHRREGETMSEMKERLLKSERNYQEGYFNTYYGHWQEGKPPYIVSIRLKLSELDTLAAKKAFLTLP